MKEPGSEREAILPERKERAERKEAAEKM